MQQRSDERIESTGNPIVKICRVHKVVPSADRVSHQVMGSVGSSPSYWSPLAVTFVCLANVFLPTHLHSTLQSRDRGSWRRTLYLTC